jgi:hypothetical protein
VGWIIRYKERLPPSLIHRRLQAGLYRSKAAVVRTLANAIPPWGTHGGHSNDCYVPLDREDNIG